MKAYRVRTSFNQIPTSTSHQKYFGSACVGISMEIDIWSDYVCPFCWIAERNLKIALEEFPHSDEVTVTWRAFELEPDFPRGSTVGMREKLVQKYGISPQRAENKIHQIQASGARVGLDFKYDTAVLSNTFDAHRLSFLAKAEGLSQEYDETLKHAHFSQGRNLEDHGVLTELAATVGLSKDRVETVLESDKFTTDVRKDEQRAHYLGARAVPFFLFGGEISLQGAQPPEVILQTLEQAWNNRSMNLGKR